MKEKNYTNYRVQPGEQHWAVIATNEDTQKDEVVKRCTNKARAYAYASKLNNHRVIHGNRLKIIMLQKGLTTEMVAELTGYSSSTINRWRNNNNQPSYGAILYLSEVLKVPKEELITF